MNKKTVIIPVFASMMILGVSCSQDNKKSPETIVENPPVVESNEQPVEPTSGASPTTPPATPTSASLKMVGLRFGSEYLTLMNEKIYNADVQGNIQSEVSAVQQSVVDANDIRETPLTARPRRIDSLNEEFFLLLQPEYNTCHMGQCLYSNGSSVHPQSNYLINKKNGEAWEIDSSFMPIPGSVKFIENERQKTVFFLAHDARDRRFWMSYPYNTNYATQLKEQLFVYGRKVLVAIDISRPEQKILQPISGNLNVEKYEVDRNGNAVVTDLNTEFKNSSYLIARNGTQPIISLIKDPDFRVNTNQSWFFRDQAGSLYHYYLKSSNSRARIAKIEIGTEEGRAVVRTLQELPLVNNNSYGYHVAAVREDQHAIYLAMKGDLMILKKDFSEVKVLAYSSQNYLNDLYLEILPGQNKAFVAGRNNEILVVTQVDLATSQVKAIDMQSIDGKMVNFSQKDGAVELVTLDDATDTTGVYGFDGSQEKFVLKERKPGQIDDRLRILVKVSGSFDI